MNERLPVFSNCTARYKVHKHKHAAPSAWNYLPCEIRYIQSTTAFKTALKTHLFQSYYHWQTLYPLRFPLLTVFVDFLRCVRCVCVCVTKVVCRLAKCDFALWFSLLFSCFLYSAPSSGFVLEVRVLQVFHYYYDFLGDFFYYYTVHHEELTHSSIEI